MTGQPRSLASIRRPSGFTGGCLPHHCGCGHGQPALDELRACGDTRDEARTPDGRGFATMTESHRAIVKSGVRRVGHATALLSSMTSIPSLNLTPSITLPSWRKPRSRRQDFSALMPIL